MKPPASVIDELIERMLSLKRQPKVGQQDPVKVGRNVQEMLQNDLAVEYAVATSFKDAIAMCEAEQRYDTRRILIKLLDDTEMDHTYWLEKQLRLIDMIGLQNYLQSQI